MKVLSVATETLRRGQEGASHPFEERASSGDSRLFVWPWSCRKLFPFLVLVSLPGLRNAASASNSSTAIYGAVRREPLSRDVEPQQARSLVLSLPEAIDQAINGPRPQGSFTLPPIAFHDPPTTPPTVSPTEVSFQPGQLVPSDIGLRLSRGLTARVFARSDQKVQYHNTSESIDMCHQRPDGAATFRDTRESNPEGWIYVSNSEDNEVTRTGGVGAFTFDKDGNVIEYKMVLEGTKGNCNGGTTSWGAWISCEETEGGRVWQVDPTGEKLPGVTTVGNDGGQFESYTHTADNQYHFVTEDYERGALRRFIPDVVNLSGSDPWNLLYGPGKTDFLVLDPDSRTFRWTNDESLARSNAALYYPGSEGMVIRGSMLFFVSKYLKTMYSLNLKKMVYTAQSTIHGAFEAEPDAIQIIQDDIPLLFFTEDDSAVAGIHGRDRDNSYYTILEAPGYLDDETTGLAFSPDHRHLYFTLQRAGVFFDVTRDDGLPFEARTLPVKHTNRKRAT